MSPQFSVVIPTFDRPDLVARALRSVLNQTFNDFEVIIVNDGSTADYTSAEAIDDSRIKWLRNERNAGPAAARNAGIAAAQGRLISFLDDDDEYLPQFLEVTYRHWQAAPTDAGPSWSSVQCKAHPKSGRARVLQRYQNLGGRGPNGPGRDHTLEQFLSIGTGFGITVPVRLLLDVGMFNERLQSVEDTDFFMRSVIAGYTPFFIPGPLVVLHDDADVRLSGSSRFRARAEECHWLLAEYADLLTNLPMLRAQLERHIAFLRLVSRRGNGGGASSGNP